MAHRFYDWIAHHAGRRPEHVALNDLAAGRQIDYRTFDRRIDALAGYLQTTCEVTNGDRVAVIANNSTDILEVQFACWRIGAIFLPINWRLTEREVRMIAEDATPAAVVLDQTFAALEGAFESTTKVTWTDGLGGDTPYEAAIRRDESPRVVDALLSDTSSLLYTAGTTGVAKGARVTHEMTLFNAINLSVPARVTRDSVHLVALPLFHTGGLNCYANPVLHAGGANVVMRTWDPAAALSYLADDELGVTHFFGVPAHFQSMAAQPGFDEATIALVNAGVGGAPCPLPMLERWSAKGVPMQQGYGLTETSPTVLVLDTDDATRKIGSAGLPALHTEVELRDAEGRAIDAADEIGEIWVRGPNVTPGYWNRPEVNASVLVDGWLSTGDLARRDLDGYYFIVDRSKDMFISGGENVYPAEVERALYEIDGIAEAAVVGIQDAQWGEVGRAYIVTEDGTDLTESEVITRCRALLARFKVPKSVVLVAELPRSAAGKVLKRTLKERGDFK